MPQEITEYYITYALDINDLMQQVRADGAWMAAARWSVCLPILQHCT